jgi:serine/threonine protein kinase
LHANNIIHRDLKLENILVTPDYKVYLIDFGLSCYLKHGLAIGMCGSPGYVAPEALSGQPYDNRCDFFSLGAILYILLSGIEPFKGPTPEQKLRDNYNG